ncbi:Rpn family recombination-promoting nuclease/putative transposase [Spirosoma sp. HMF3257]|uniref:Rpn family recombination-promoting nuclease/putative transposase n=1 Tax=Spirosoma telluris TaxID=2183553 RepID=A0A327NTK9_9BACT|nr:Rpn family recombination-promoting nuclease/putative transposase [Spirosoma telluris]RAI77306.1 hypothetical protein HMF3257_29690 [Spirosoma telluris]
MDSLYSDEQIFIPLISDYGFKVTFGNESNTLFLRKSLQALIKSDIPIREVRFDKNTFEGTTQDGRSGIFDLACIDENGNHFIVEMQYGDAPHFVQRMKFYAFHKLNVLVEKGDFDYGRLPKIYCIGVLAKPILPYLDYHTVVNLRSEQGELIDDQMTFAVIELTKFTLQVEDIKTDLEKLLYTMKTLHKAKEPIQFPQFWNEEWLKIAIDELDRRKMTPDERAAFAMMIARNAEAVYAEKRKIEAVKTDAVERALQAGLAVDLIAQINNVSTQFVEEIRAQLNKI